MDAGGAGRSWGREARPASRGLGRGWELRLHPERSGGVLGVRVQDEPEGRGGQCRGARWRQEGQEALREQRGLSTAGEAAQEWGASQQLRGAGGPPASLPPALPFAAIPAAGSYLADGCLPSAELLLSLIESFPKFLLV